MSEGKYCKGFQQTYNYTHRFRYNIIQWIDSGISNLQTDLNQRFTKQKNNCTGFPQIIEPKQKSLQSLAWRDFVNIS